MAKSPKTYSPPLCLHCGRVSELVQGDVIYPHIQHLHDDYYYRCVKSCDAYVGCHGKTEKPLGRPGNKETRDARRHVHKVLDPIWKRAHELSIYADSDTSSDKAIKIIQMSARGRVYAWLADKMEIDKRDCHTANFDIDQCRLAYGFCKRMTYPEIRKWYKAQPKSKIKKPPMLAAGVGSVPKDMLKKLLELDDIEGRAWAAGVSFPVWLDAKTKCRNLAETTVDDYFSLLEKELERILKSQ